MASSQVMSQVRSMHRPVGQRAPRLRHVSTDDQSLTAQFDQLHAAGATRVVRETASGVRRDRAGLAKLLKEVEPGDVVLVTRLDRLARSTRDLLNVLGSLAEKGALFRSLADP
mgnify:CR=1 FL=1